MLADSVLWRCAVLVRDEAGAAGGARRECILCPQTEEWHVHVDDRLDVGVMATGSWGGDDGVSWMRLRLLDSVAEPRWIRVEYCKGVDAIKMSAATIWRYFGRRVEGAQCTLQVAFSPLPEYIALHAKSPVLQPARITIRLLADISTDNALFHRTLPQTLLSSLSTLSPTLCQDGDTQWITLHPDPNYAADSNSSLGEDVKHNSQDLHPTWQLPIEISGIGGEAFVDFASVEVVLELDPKLVLLPPAPQHSLAASVFDALVKHVARALDRPSPSHPEIFVLSGSCGSGKRSVAVAACHSRGIPVKVLAIENIEQLSRGTSACAWIMRATRPGDHLYNLARSVLQMQTGASTMLLLLLEEELKASDSLCRLLAAHWSIPSLSADQRRLVFGHLGVAQDAQMMGPEIVSDSAGLNIAGIAAAVDFWHLEGGKKTMSECIKAVRERTSQHQENTEIPKVHWSDVAGLEEAKRLLVETISTPLLQGHRIPAQLGRRCGLLLYGPPGTGKTMLAKAVATEFSLHFISVKGPELLDIYVGESEAHVRGVFEKARKHRPCVLFFDELDSLVVARGRDGDSGGVTDRLVSQFLTEMDTLYWDTEGRGRDVFVIGATNRPDLLDPALLRPGRFDKMIYLGLPETAKEQAEIMRAASRNYLTSVDVDFDRLAEGLAKNLTPADLAAICHSAMRGAIGRVISRSEAGMGSMAGQGYAVTIDRADFEEAILSACPSVSASDLALYDRLKI